MVSFKSLSKSSSKSLSLLLNRKFWGSAVLIFVFAVIIALFLAFQQGWFSKFEGLESQPKLLKNYPNIIKILDGAIQKVQTNPRVNGQDMRYGPLLTELNLVKNRIQNDKTSPNPGYNEFNVMVNKTVNASNDSAMKAQMKVILDTVKPVASAPASTRVAPAHASTTSSKSLKDLYPTIREEIDHMFNSQMITREGVYKQYIHIEPIGKLYNLAVKVLESVDKTDGSGQVALKALLDGFTREEDKTVAHFTQVLGTSQQNVNDFIATYKRNKMLIDFMTRVVNKINDYEYYPSLPFFALNTKNMDIKLGNIKNSDAFKPNPSDDTNTINKKANLQKLYQALLSDYKTVQKGHESFHRFMRYVIENQISIPEMNYFRSLMSYGNISYRFTMGSVEL